MLMQHPHFFRHIYMLMFMQNPFQFIDGRSQELVFMIDQLELSIPFAVCLPESPDGSVLQFVLHQPKGHNGENIVVEHCIQQNSWTVGFPGCDIGQLMSGSVIFKELPGTAAGFPHGKFLPLQISNRQFSPCIKGMLFANRQYQTVINDRQNYQIRRENFAFHYGSV